MTKTRVWYTYKHDKTIYNSYVTRDLRDGINKSVMVRVIGPWGQPEEQPIQIDRIIREEVEDDA